MIDAAAGGGRAEGDAAGVGARTAGVAGTQRGHGSGRGYEVGADVG